MSIVRFHMDSTVQHKFARILLYVFPISLLTVPISAQETSVVFEDRTKQLGLQPANSSACWADFNNDGWVDLVAGGVWQNSDGKKFTKVFDIGNCIAADFDNDGLTDLFSWSALKLFRNQGDMKFAEVKLPELPKCVSQGACWGDFNGDGFVDLYIGGYEDWNAGITWPFIFLINEKGKSFRVERSESVGRARGVTACDFDQDGDLDVYVSNYRLQPNNLWLNDGAGAFKDAAGDRGAVATSTGFGGGHSIGAAWGDFNNDGLIDLFAGNFAHVDNRGDQPKSRFLQNLGSEKGYKFQDRGTCGVHYQESYASPSVGDFDNDGNLDLFFTTVYGVASFGRKNNSVLFRNNGSFKVTDVTVGAKLNNLSPTYQAAWADYNNDGRLDLISDGKLFENQGNANSWLAVRLVGDGKTVNHDAIGAQVRVKLSEKTLTRQVEAGTGQGNQNELKLHFGLGDHKTGVQIEVLWPNKRKQTVASVEINKLTTIRLDQ